MTKKELERIKQAYYSGLKVQIWFDGYWKNFDARDYSMYPDPFSENRQYRVVGSDYADIAEKHIAELEKESEKLKNRNAELKGMYAYSAREASTYKQFLELKETENAELKAKIEKLKCCENCRFSIFDTDDLCVVGCNAGKCFNHEKWELQEG